MQEITGNLWDYFKKPCTSVLITTNGTIKTDGSVVMGRGCAKEAKDRFPQLPRELGRLVRRNGNVVQKILSRLWAFPVKHNFWEKADPELIACSAGSLNALALSSPHWTWVLPRPGCNNGRLDWESQVKPLLVHLPDNVLVITEEPWT